jgi:hypothetical protein
VHWQPSVARLAGTHGPSPPHTRVRVWGSAAVGSSCPTGSGRSWLPFPGEGEAVSAHGLCGVGCRGS